MEPEGFFRSSQKLSTGPFTEAHQSSLRSHLYSAAPS
jgi:hypothetical protein